MSIFSKSVQYSWRYGLFCKKHLLKNIKERTKTGYYSLFQTLWDVRRKCQYLRVPTSVLLRVFWNGKSKLCRLLFCKNVLNKRKGNWRKMKRKMKMKKKKRTWDAESVSVRKLIISSTILQSFKRKHPIVTEKLTHLSKPIPPTNFSTYGGSVWKDIYLLDINDTFIFNF